MLLRIIICLFSIFLSISALPYPSNEAQQLGIFPNDKTHLKKSDIFPSNEEKDIEYGSDSSIDEEESIAANRMKKQGHAGQTGLKHVKTVNNGLTNLLKLSKIRRLSPGLFTLFIIQKLLLPRMKNSM